MDFYTVEEVAKRLGVNNTTVGRYLRAGKIKGFKLGGNRSGWRIYKDSFDAFCRGDIQLESTGEAK